MYVCMYVCVYALLLYSKQFVGINSKGMGQAGSLVVHVSNITQTLTSQQAGPLGYAPTQIVSVHYYSIC